MLDLRNMVNIGLRPSIIKLLFLCAIIIIFGTGCGSGGGGGDTNPASSSGIVLAESRLGTSGGFVDVNGDGIEDLVVGAPEASG